MDFDLDELEDFDLQKPTYEVWAAGYSAESKESVVDQLLYSASDPDDAITFADSVSSRDACIYDLLLSASATYLILEVDTLVDETGGAGVIYRRRINVDRQELFEVTVKETDLVFNDDGLLCLNGVTYPVGTNLSVSILGAPSYACARTIIYKVVGQYSSGVLCEFVE